MASSNRKAPSAGQKVTPGAQAPIKHEGAGPVPPGSLAAESARSGGAYAANTGSEGTAQHVEYAETEEQGGRAPSYVVDQYLKDRGGPHGKNITEDEGLPEAGAGAEVGSPEDPGREAEREFALMRERKGRAAGARQEELDTGTRYDVLGSDERA